MGFFFFFFLGVSSFCNRSRNSSQVLNGLLLLLPTNFASATNPESKAIQRASSHTQGTNQGGSKSQWKNQETREIAKIINTFVSARGGGGGNVWVSCAPIGCDVDSTNQRPALVHVSWEISRCLSAYLPT